MKTSPRIGKYVIENLTVAMYSDSRSIFREYIQNSADALDKAIKQGLISEKDASIYIQINKDFKSITIEDNGTGITSKQVIPLLQNIAESEKKIGEEKGFRGIGRLGGIAYCESLVFETTAKGENVKSIMTWDAKRLREIVNNRKYKETASQVIEKVTTFHEEPENIEQHYFKVIMRGVTNEELLDEDEIKNYLEMVAPIPFSGGFIYKNEIYKELKKENITIDEYNIFLNTEQLYKSHKADLFKVRGIRNDKIGNIIDIRYFKDYDKNNKLLYWGWHSVSDIQGTRLDRSNKARGLRVRTGNIQIGDENRLEKLFGTNTNTRFNFYVTGEVYTFHYDLIPNARRDDFIDNPTFIEFKNKLSRICTTIKKLSNDANDAANAQKKVHQFKEQEALYEEKKKSGFNSQEELKQLNKELQEKKKKAEQGKAVLQKLKNKAIQTESDDIKPLNKILEHLINKEDYIINSPQIETKIKREDFRQSKWSKLNRKEQKLLSKISNIIYKTLDKERAELLIGKLEEEFK